MRVVSHKTLFDYYTDNNQSKTALELWYAKITKQDFDNFNDLKRAFSSADFVGNHRVVFNIKGNNYRLVCIVKYSSQKVYVRFIGTHAEYDRINAKTI